MRRHGTLGRLLHSTNAAHLALVLLTGSAAVGVTGCRVNSDDLHRWEETQRGPDKLQAVLLHDKYELPLRVEAAMSLIRMKPRGGRFVGIDYLVDTLEKIPADQRGKILEGLVPLIITELKKEAPAAQAGQPPPPDTTIPYKDASYAILTYEKEQLLDDEKLRGDLNGALEEWAMKDFERRLENRQQKTGMEQLLRYLGGDGIDQIPKEITPTSRNLEKIANLVDEIGSKETREAASAKYVEVAKYILGPEWLEVSSRRLEQANEASGRKPDKEQFQGQLDLYQDEELQRVLGTMRKVGGRPAIDYALELAENEKLKEDRRVWALAALELRIDPKEKKDVDRIFAIATNEKTSDKVKEMALARIAELDREAVIGKLWDVFKSDRWKVRRVAGSIILRMSKMSHLGEFMSKLPEKEAKGFAANEARLYADYFIDFKDGDIRKELEKYLAAETPPAQRSVAFAFYEMRGTPADLKMLEPYKADKGPIPSCETGEGCKWECPQPKDPKAPDGEKELKEVKTVGEYVTWCVESQIKLREEARKAAEKKASEEKN